ncbi:fatty acid synthase-like [Brevipalpus obovatus]|uniref:fatty acid synthase-like n=1 Tax=Brevipalpus obovatus TaxID=246614 RepID=UPI003D9DBE21
MDLNSNEWRSKLNYVRRKWRVKEDVVISGMSGRFPKSENIQEFTQNLFKGVDMTSSGDDRFPAGKHGYPENSGTIENLGKFDAGFFGIPEKDAHYMDPQLRKLLEVSFEAIVDAVLNSLIMRASYFSGISVKELNGTNTGFFSGCCFEETDMAFNENPLNSPLYSQNYTSTISQAFGLKGPIGSFDTACGSSFAALNEAFVALKSGVCDRALVVGYNICLVPLVTLQFRDLLMVSSSGKSKSLDESADGYGRSEAVCCVMLQLKPEAKRIYSTVVNCRSNSDGYKEQGITFPSVKMQRQLMAETYDEVGLDPTTVEYVEAHTTGTQAGDPVELKAIYDVFCYQRSAENPVKIGSLKSNMGHAEGAAGMCAMIKANIVFQSGYIPPNIHFKKPNPRIEGLMNGKLVPILEKTPFKGEYISLNCFGFGGSNAHVILKRHENKCSPKSPRTVSQVPRLIPICGRTRQSVQQIQRFLKDNKNSLTNEFFDFLNQFSKTPSMPYKGYTLINKSADGFTFDEYISENPPSEPCYISVVLPSNEIKFESRFMEIPAFSNALNRLSKYVEPVGINLPQLLLGDSKASRTCEQTVATVASLLIIINLMKNLKVPVSDFIGNSFGQLAFAFARNRITEERALNAAYWLGHFINHKETSFKQFDMVNGEFFRENTSHSSEDKTIESYYNISESLIRMKLNGFKVDLGGSAWSTSNIFHSLKFFEKYALTVQKIGDENALESSPIADDMFPSQRLNTELLHEVINRLLSESILINFESSDCSNLHLKQIQFLDTDHLELDRFFKAIGQLYSMHIPINIDCLYPAVEYPVPIETHSLHSLIAFDHSQEYKVFKYPEYYNHITEKSSFVHTVNLSNAEDWFYSDHKIDGRILFPATGMLVHVWGVVAKFHAVDARISKVLFRDVAFLRATVLSDKEVSFRVNYMPHNNSFIITESGSLVATGKIFMIKNIDDAKENYQISDGEIKSKSEEEVECHNLSRDDIYKELRNRGYDYGPSFRCLVKADQYGRRGKVEWKEVSQLSLKSGSIYEKIYEPELSFLKTWITYSDSVLQLALLTNRFNRSLFVPTGIETMLVDAEQILANVNAFKEREFRKKSQPKDSIGQLEKEQFEPKVIEESETSGQESPVTSSVYHDPITRTIVSDGLWMRGLKASLALRKSQGVTINTQDFIPFNEPAMLEPKYRAQLESYLETCEKYAALINTTKGIDDEPLMKPDEIEKLKQNFAFTVDPSFGLLNYLISMLRGDKEPVEVTETVQDILIGKDSRYTMLNQFLEPFVVTGLNEVVYGGQANSSIGVLEHNDGKNCYVEMIKAAIESQSLGTAKISYTFASSQLNIEMEEKVSGKTSFITWDAESPLAGNIARADFLIYKNYSGNVSSFRSKIEHLTQAIKPDGFLLVVLRESVTENIENICSVPQLKSVITELRACCTRGEDVINSMEEIGWTCVSNRLLDPELLPIRGLLFRKKPDISQEPKIIHVSPLDYGWIEELKTAYSGEDETAPIWLIGDPRYDQGVVGLVKCLGLEPSGDRLICIANRFHDRGIDFRNLSSEDPLLRHISEKRLKFNIYDPDCGWGEYNHIEVEEKYEEDPRCLTEASNNVRLEIMQSGDLSSLRWSKFSAIKPSSVRSIINVSYASLNFKDIMLTSGRLPLVFAPSARKIKEETMSVKIDTFYNNEKIEKIEKIHILGLEFSGYDENGNRVMGMVPSGAMATQVSIGPEDFILPIPDNWSLEEAATVPVVYGTAVYGLMMRGNLKRGESVLIHAGSGGVGIAAINLCLSYNCTIYTTVGTPEKRKFILERFPQLTEANIGNSRDTSFEEMILRETDGRGVDIVLNSLSDDKLQASLRCLAPGGRFLEIGKYDGFKNSLVDLGFLGNGRSFHGVMLDSFFNPAPEEMATVAVQKKQLEKLLHELLKKRLIKPLFIKVFDMGEAERAFRYMAAGKHMGKVVIKIRNQEDAQNLILVPALKTVTFHSDRVYIIVGGFGGLGLEVALWMAFNGAKNIVINSRSGPKTSYHRYCLERLAEKNVNSVISTHDLTTEKGTRELFNSLSLPVGGIFNSALVLSDAIFKDQTEETFTKVCLSKINITNNLDKISREMCPLLDYFVVFSSVASARGNFGQSNYGMANSFMESLCERRRKDGLHGLAIQWGFIGDVGFVVEMLGSDVQSIRGTQAQRLHSVLATLERILNYPSSTVLSVVRSEGKKLESSGDIIKSICHILGIKDIYALDPQITLGELGMDSLMAIEVQQTMDRNFNVSITPKEVRQMKICELIALSKKMDSNEVIQSKLKRIDLNLSEELQLLPEEPTKILNNCTGELMFALPPIQGHYRAFSGLLERLEQPVIGLNWTYDLSHLTTLEDVAKVMVDRIMNLTSSSEISLIGYSYGGVLAREIARQFEERKSGPKVTRLVLLDSDPTSIKESIIVSSGYDLSSRSVDIEEREFIRASMKPFQIENSQFEEEIKNSTSRKERFDVAKKYLILSGMEASQAEKLTKINELMHQKFDLILSYKPQEPCNCKVIHLRARNENQELLHAPNLTNIGSQHFFNGDHDDYINENLDQITDKVTEFLN